MTEQDNMPPSDATLPHGPSTEPAPPAPAALPAELVLSAEHAALYLCMTPAQLADAEKPRRTDGPRAGKSAKALPPPPVYTVAAVRARAPQQPAAGGLEAAMQAGLTGWVTAKLPFFAELDARERRGPRTLIACAWNRADGDRETHFAALVKGRIRCTWLTAAEASTSRWADADTHRAFTAQGLALMEHDRAAIAAALAASKALSAA